MTRPITKLGLAALLAASALLAACSSPSSTAGSSAAASSTAASGPIKVVASTDVWGSIVSTIGGDHVDVASLISDPSADPHSYEASARNQLAVSRAAVVVENGGGYDDFVDRMVSSAGSKATVINAVDVSGYAATGGGDANEHVWYDFPTVDKVVDKIATALTEADPANGPEFSANASTFADRVAKLQQQELDIKAKSAGG